MKKLICLAIFPLFIPLSGFGHFKNPRISIFSASSSTKKLNPEDINKVLEDMNIDINSVPENVLNNLKGAINDPLKLMTDYNLSLSDILKSEIYTAFFFWKPGSFKYSTNGKTFFPPHAGG